MKGNSNKRKAYNIYNSQRPMIRKDEGKLLDSSRQREPSQQMGKKQLWISIQDQKHGKVSLFVKFA